MIQLDPFKRVMFPLGDSTTPRISKVLHADCQELHNAIKTVSSPGRDRVIHDCLEQLALPPDLGDL